MGINRRRSNRRKFKINKNYIIPFVCVIVTCSTIIVSTSIIRNLENQIPIENKVDGVVQGKTERITLTENETLQINNMFSFLMSNLDIGQELSSEDVRYRLVSKYYAKDNKFTKIPDEHVDKIDPETYRNLGYVYFDDYKEDYMYISKINYENTYRKLFDIDTMKSISEYYISDLNAYVVPKNNDVYDNSRYMLADILYNQKQDFYTATLYEINLLKLYEKKDYLQVEEYLNSTQIDNEFLTGKIFKVKFKKIDDNFVFIDYAI